MSVRFFRWIGPQWIWQGKDINAVYLTFDDGPHPLATPIVLDFLAKHQLKACFFCLGENVKAHPDIYARIIREGHVVGNHTFGHESAFCSSPNSYLSSINKAGKEIESRYFRPPYGRITPLHARKIMKQKYTIVMWTWMSHDFSASMTLRKLQRRCDDIKGGDILVFHDNEKTASKIEAYLTAAVQIIQRKQLNFRTFEMP